MDRVRLTPLPPATVRLSDGRVVEVSRVRVSPLQLAQLIVDETDRGAAVDSTRWPGVMWSEAALVRGHHFTYEGLVDSIELHEEDLRQIVINAGNAATLTVEYSVTFGNILDAALDEQARRRVK